MTRKELVERLTASGFTVEAHGSGAFFIHTRDGVAVVDPKDGPGTISSESITLQDMAKIVAVFTSKAQPKPRPPHGAEEESA